MVWLLWLSFLFWVTLNYIILGLKTAKVQALKTAEVVAEKTYIYTDQVGEQTTLSSYFPDKLAFGLVFDLVGPEDF